MSVDVIPPAIPLVTGSPIFGAPNLSLKMPAAVGLMTRSPIFGRPTVHFLQAIPDATPLVPGSPIFGTPTLAIAPTQLVTGRPLFGQPVLRQIHVLLAQSTITARPYLGTPPSHQIIQAVVEGVFLPENIERDAKGGPRFNTSVFMGANGSEYRSVNWDRQIGKWSLNLGYRPDDDPDFLSVLNTFYTVRGNGFGFLFTDHSDYSAKNQPLALVPGSSNIYQIQKIYSAGVGSYARKITRPKAGTVVIKLAGAPQAATITYNGGLVTGISPGCTASF